jgi:glycosyltransferase involved in cell wall biosynthesis
MKIALLTTDNREHYKDYSTPAPHFGTAPEALLEGFAGMPEVEVHVVSCAREPTQSPAKLAPNIYFHGLHVPKWGWVRTGYQGCIRATRAKLRQIRPDIVHGQGTEKDCAISAVLSGFPNVLTLHGVMDNMRRVLRSKPGSYMWLAARFESYTVRKTAGVFCNSSHTEKFLRPRARRFWRVPNPLRASFLSPAPEFTPRKKCLLLNIGVVSCYKRQIEVLGVLETLRKEGFSFEMVFVGQASEASPYAAEFLNRLEPLRAGGFARHVGLLPGAELIKLMDSASALIHTPTEESFGLVVAESLARGLRVFGFDVGGVRDTAAGVPGANFLNDGDWNSLAKEVGTWIGKGFPLSPESSKVMAGLYHPETIARRHLQIYRDVLSAAS